MVTPPKGELPLTTHVFRGHDNCFSLIISAPSSKLGKNLCRKERPWKIKIIHGPLEPQEPPLKGIWGRGDHNPRERGKLGKNWG